MKNNGSSHKEATQEQDYFSAGGMARRVRQPIFERELLSAGKTVVDSLTVGVHRDEEALVNACLYIGQLERVGLTSRIQVALYKINGTMGIEGRAREEAVQAHAEIYFPRNASKEDKKRLEKIQYKNRNQDDEDKKNKDGGG